MTRLTILDVYYTVSDVFEDDTLCLALALKVVGAKEPINYVYEKLIKLNLEKCEGSLVKLHNLIKDDRTHEGLVQLMKLAKVSYIDKNPVRLTYTKDSTIC